MRDLGTWRRTAKRERHGVVWAICWELKEYSSDRLSELASDFWVCLKRENSFQLPFALMDGRYYQPTLLSDFVEVHETIFCFVLLSPCVQQGGCHSTCLTIPNRTMSAISSLACNDQTGHRKWCGQNCICYSFGDMRLSGEILPGSSVKTWEAETVGSVNWPFKISVFFIFTHFLSEMPNPAPVLRDIGIIFRVCIQRAASFSCLYKCRVSTLPFVFMG